MLEAPGRADITPPASVPDLLGQNLVRGLHRTGIGQWTLQSKRPMRPVSFNECLPPNEYPFLFRKGLISASTPIDMDVSHLLTSQTAKM